MLNHFAHTSLPSMLFAPALEWPSVCWLKCKHFLELSFLGEGVSQSAFRLSLCTLELSAGEGTEAAVA